MRKRILIVEDEELIARSLAFSLRREGFDVDLAHDGRSALAAAREHEPDVVILDLVLPGDLDGYDVCRRLRTQSAAAIVMVSARGTEIDKVLGLERGADDYVTKPFSTPELIARVRAHLRRIDVDRHGGDVSVRSVGDLTIDRGRRAVTVEGRPVKLTASEFVVLEALSERPDEVVTRGELIARLWSSDFAGDTRACDAHIRRLRAKIEDDPRRPKRLLTVRGVGYRLVA
jgi:two-component system response regulator RegX3